MAQLLAWNHGITVRTITSWAYPTVSAYLTEENIAGLLEDPSVDSLSVTTTPLRHSASPPWSNDTSTPDFISYGKNAMDMNDNVTPSNRVYMIDAGINATNLGHADLDGGAVVTEPYMSGITNPAAQGHSMHVAGILTAQHGNSYGIKGMNNNSPVSSVYVGDDEGQNNGAFDWVVADTEADGSFAVANLSSNGTTLSGTGSTAKFMRKASARVLIVNSAGNTNTSACQRSFSPMSQRDGVLVVSAVRDDGQYVSSIDQTNAPSYGDNGNAVAYGSCVDVWAPGQLIYSDWNIAPFWMLLSGTSMAAPHVSALAARHGTSSTSPVIREAYIRSKLFSTGYNDPASIPIKVPSYTQTPLYTLPTKLTATATASHTYTTFTASKAVDGDFLTTKWNAGVAPVFGVTEPELRLDLGSTKTLWALRFMPTMTPSGLASHSLYVGTTYPASTWVGDIAATMDDGETMTFNLNGYSARYLRLVTTVSPSWAGYYEVEVFGN